jgi:hypothetical protein
MLTPVATPTLDIAYVHGSSASDVWVLGMTNGQALHYDGTTWSSHNIDAGVWAPGLFVVSPTDAWVPAAAVANSPRLAHWDGISWSTVPSLIGPEAVWARGSSDVWVVGAGVEHFDGATWTTVPLFNDAEIAGVTGNATSVWLDLELPSSYARWDGSTWTTERSLGQGSLWATTGELWVVTIDGGRVARKSLPP